MAYKSDFFSIQIHFPIMIFELITSIFIAIIGSVIFLRWRERKTVPTLYLSLALFSMSAAILVVFMGLASWFFTWIAAGMINVISPVFYSLSLPLGYSIVVLYDIFLFLFTIHIFSDKNEKKVIPLIIGGTFLIILLFLPWNYWGINPSASDPPSIRTLILIFFLLFNMVTYVILAFYAFRESKQAEQKINQKAFQSIGLGQILNVVVFIWFLSDAIIILLDPGSPGYSIFIYLAWLTALTAAFLFYLGYIQPNWFKKMIEKRN